MSGSNHTILTFTTFLTFLLGLACIDTGHNWSDDFALYLSQCQALQQGNMQELLESNSYAMEHSYGHVGPYLYPYGFPFLLWPVYQLLGMNLWAMKVYCLLFLVASLPFIYLILKQYQLPHFSALALSLLIGLNYHFIRFSDHILSDLPFLFFSVFSFYGIQQSCFKRTFQALGLGLLIFFTYSIRDIGIVLLLCLSFSQWQQKEVLSFKTIMLPYITFGIAWTLQHFLLPPTGGQHLHFLSETSMATLGNNLYYYWLLLGNYFLIFRGLPFFLQAILSTLVCLLITIGWFQKSRSYPLPSIYLSSIMGIYLIWVSFQGMRFLFPILPFLLLFFWEGIQAVFPSPNKQKIILLLLLGSSLSQSLFTSYYYWHKDTNEAYSQELQELYQFIQQTTPKNAIIVFHKPRALRLFTGRNAVQKNIAAAAYILAPKSSHHSPMDTVIFQRSHYQLIKKAASPSTKMEQPIFK